MKLARLPAAAWDLSCPDWERRLIARESLIPKLPLNALDAARAVAIFNKLRLADVIGTPAMAEAGGDWFREIIAALFGSLDHATGKRMIRELFLLVPKKNAKTSNGALLMLTALLLNERPHAPFILTAPVQDVAEIAFGAIAGAIALDDVLRSKLHVREHVKTIVHRETKAELQVMTFDPSVVTGQKCAGILIDELHVVAKMSKAPSAIRQLRGGMIPYPEAFLAFITTQSEEAPSGVFLAELDKARDVRDGKRQVAMLPVLYEFPESMQRSDEWRKVKNWDMVTPNAGRSVQIDRLAEEMRVAEETSDVELRLWASQHLNLEIGLALNAHSWVGAHFWEASGINGMTLEDVLTRSEVVTVGIDGGGLDDMLGLAVVGREVETGKWLVWTHAWIHPIVLEQRKSESQRFRDFEADGDLTIVEEIGQDVEQVADYVEQIDKVGLLDKVGVDQAGIGAIIDALNARGIALERIVGIPQGWRLVGAIKTGERKIAERALVHGSTKMMAWVLGNARVEPRGNAVIITKQISGAAKIDPLMALFDAIALMAMNPKPQKANFQMLFV